MEPLEFSMSMPDYRERVDDDSLEGAVTRLEQLALSFPTLRHAAGVAPWNQEQFEAWVIEKVEIVKITDRDYEAQCALYAGLFILSLTDRYDGFPFHFAFSTWDDAHRAAFIAWAFDPFWVLEQSDDEGV